MMTQGMIPWRRHRGIFTAFYGSLYSHSPGKTPRCLLQGVFPSDIINGQQCNFSLISWKTHDKRWLLRGVAKSKNLGRQVVMRRLLICQNLGGRAPTLPTRFLHPCLHKCCHPIVCCYCNLSLRVGSSKAKLLSCLCLHCKCLQGFTGTLLGNRSAGISNLRGLHVYP